MFEPGTQVGRYEIQRKLGRGGMGAVYVAHDPVLGRMVAIKVFAGELDLPDARERFSREARAAAALSHPNIVTVYDFGEFESQPFIVMEYVPGETLAGFIRRKTPVTMADKVRWMEELCSGAGYAHQMQLVHRDIKPANLMIDRSGRLKILDFGIARMLGRASNTALMIGTPGYMAPEQITGDPVDHRADQFSIGVVFYELLAYTEAFPGDTLPTITHRVLNEDPVPLTRLAPDASPELVAIIQQTLKKNPAERFSDSESLRTAIARVRRETSNQAWNAPTVAAGRDTPTAPTGSRGTGSSRRREDEAVGVAQLTPFPDPRRTDREALARRRTIQLEAALKEARAHLAQGQLELALDACQQALTLDEYHVGALRLEEEIETVLRRHVEPAPSGPFAVPTVTRAETLWPDVGGRPSEAATRLDHPTPAGIPPARPTRAPVPPPSVPPVPVSPSPQPVAKAPAEQESKKGSPIGPIGAGIAARSKAIADGAISVASSVARDRRMLGIAAIGAAVVIAAVVGVMLLSGPASTGSLVIDAVPWATVTAIETEGGESVALPPSPSTPLSLTLPTGTYQVVLAGPPPELQTQRITVQIETGTSTVAPVIRFRALTPDEYFEQYLAAPTASTPEPGIVPAELVPATPAPASPFASQDAVGAKP